MRVDRFSIKLLPHEMLRGDTAIHIEYMRYQSILSPHKEHSTNTGKVNVYEKLLALRLALERYHIRHCQSVPILVHFGCLFLRL